MTQNSLRPLEIRSIRAAWTDVHKSVERSVCYPDEPNFRLDAVHEFLVDRWFETCDAALQKPIAVA